MRTKIYLWLPFFLLFAGVARGEAERVVFAHQNGWAYTPLYVVKELGLIEKHAQKAGLPLQADFRNLGNAGTIRDALLSGDVHFGVVGPPTLITMFDKTKDFKLVANFVSLPMLLVTNNMQLSSICDFLKFPGKIGLPTVKSSVQAVTLQMAAKKSCGKFDALDKLTVGLTHPDSMSALLSGKGDITAHFSSPPFQSKELEGAEGKRKALLNSYDVLGGKTSFILLIGSEKWAKKNPRATAVVSAAIEEAIQIVSQEKKRAAEIYLKNERVKDSVAEIVKQMSEKGVSFSSTPDRIETYSNFMNEIGTIKSKPTWKDMSMPFLHGRAGS